MGLYVGQVSEHAIIFNEEGKILLLLHNGPSLKFKNKWTIPGGRLEMDDTPGLALMRELEEETGLTDVELILPCFANRYGADEPEKYSVAYLARVKGNPKIVLPPHENHDAYEWVTPEEALTRTFIFDKIPDVIRGVLLWAKRLGLVD